MSFQSFNVKKMMKLYKTYITLTRAYKDKQEGQVGEA